MWHGKHHHRAGILVFTYQMFSYVYLNFDPVDDWKLREAAQATASKFIDIIESHLNTISPKVCSFNSWKRKLHSEWPAGGCQRSS